MLAQRIQSIGRPLIREALKGCWQYYEQSGTTVVDQSGNGYTGTLVASPTWAVTGPQGLPFLTLNGTSQYVSVPTDVNVVGAGTVCGWFKGTSDTSQAFFTLSSSETNAALYGVYIGNGITSTLTNELITVGRVVVPPGDSDNIVVGYTTSNRNELFDGAWHHVAIVLSETTGVRPKIYLDGVLKTTTDGTIGATPVFSFGISGINAAYFGGRRYNATTALFVNGSLADNRIYLRALSATEIAAIASGNG